MCCNIDLNALPGCCSWHTHPRFVRERWRRCGQSVSQLLPRKHGGGAMCTPCGRLLSCSGDQRGAPHRLGPFFHDRPSCRTKTPRPHTLLTQIALNSHTDNLATMSTTNQSTQKRKQCEFVGEDGYEHVMPTPMCPNQPLKQPVHVAGCPAAIRSNRVAGVPPTRSTASASTSTTTVTGALFLFCAARWRVCVGGWVDMGGWQARAC